MPSTKQQRSTNVPARYVPLGSTLAREVAEMRDRMRRIFQEPFGRNVPDLLAGDMAQAVGWLPAVEVSESDTEFTIVAELPGLQPKDVQVDYDDGTLTLRGERQEQREEKDRRFHLWERSYGTFLRTFTFPVAIDEEKIHAEHKDGLLEVHLPKLPGSKSQGRRIAVTGKP
jgi:HSP20 family protein